MKPIRWEHPPFSNDNLCEIFDQILASDLGFVSAAPGDSVGWVNFRDDATDDQINTAMAIANAFDPAAAAANKAAKQAVEDEAKQARNADLVPFKLISNLLDDNMRDAEALNKATLVQVRGIVAELLIREAAILRGMARIIEPMVIEDGAQ